MLNLFISVDPQGQDFHAGYQKKDHINLQNIKRLRSSIDLNINNTSVLSSD